MALTKRERNTGMITVAVMAIFGLDRFLLTPYLDRRDMLISEEQNLVIEYRKARGVLSRWREVSHLWETGEPEAGVKPARGDEESTALKALRDWAEESGMALSFLKPEGTVRHGQLEEKIFQVAGTGSMKQISAFLWRVESADIPLKTRDMQMAARREGTDDLTIQLRIGQLYLPGRAVPPAEAEIDAAFPQGRYTVLSERGMFLRDRTPRKVQAVAREPIIREMPSVRRMTLTGIVRQDTEYIAFFEEFATRQVTRVRSGEKVMDGTIEKITLDYADYNENGNVRRVKIGENLEKILSSSGGGEVSASTRAPAIEVLPSSAPAASGENTLIERMRERRRQEIE